MVGPEQLFATGQSGLKFLDGIKPGARYEFRLYSEEAAPTKTAGLSAVERTDTISAEPNLVPAGPGLGRTKISWATLTGAEAEVYVSQDGGPERLFAAGGSGSREAADHDREQLRVPAILPGWSGAATVGEDRSYQISGRRLELPRYSCHLQRRKTAPLFDCVGQGLRRSRVAPRHAVAM